MRAGLVDAAAQPFRNAAFGAATGYLNGGHSISGTPALTPPFAGAPTYQLRIVSIGASATVSWGPYFRAIPVGPGPVAISAMVYANRARRVTVNHENVSGGSATVTLQPEVWTRVDLPIGTVNAGGVTTITAYGTAGDVTQAGDVIGISAIVTRPGTRHSAWSPGGFIYPRP